VNYRSIEVSSQQQVASGTYQQVGFLQLSGYLLCLFYGCVFQEPTTLGIDSKRVMM
jgi:hypothetical protein